MLASPRRGALRALALGALLALGAGLALAGSASASGPAWTTYHHDAARSGIDPDSTSPVSPTQAWQSQALDGSIYGEPLVYGSRIYVATENDGVYALDAASGAVLWRRSAGTAVDAGALPCGNISPTVGVTSTPVIDPATNRIYVVADSWDGSNASSIHHQLVSFDLVSGAPSTPVNVDPPGSTPTELLQRPGLALDGHEIVIGYGGNAGDCGSYHGWLVGVNEDGSGPHALFEADPGAGHVHGAIWGAGNAPAIDNAGNIYAATGNGSSGSSFDYGESVLKLAPSLGAPLDYWAPVNWSSLDGSDADIGSSEPLLLPSGLLFQAGKDGNGYLVRSTTGSMGHETHGPAAQLPGFCPSGAFGGGIYVDGTIYVACYDGLQALSLDASTPSLRLKSSWSVPNQPIGPPIYAGGLVWSTDWVNGALYGLNPQTGTVAYSASLGSFNHFTSASAGGGRLFVANDTKVTALKIANYVPPGPGSGGSGRLRMTGVHLGRRAVHAKQGTKLRLTVSEPARIKVTLVQLLAGHKLKGRCTGKAQHGRHCVRKLRRRVLHFFARAGSDRFKLRLAGLRPGRYEVVVLATSRDGKATKTLKLRIEAPRRR